MRFDISAFSRVGPVLFITLFLLISQFVFLLIYEDKKSYRLIIKFPIPLECMAGRFSPGDQHHCSTSRAFPKLKSVPMVFFFCSFILMVEGVFTRPAHSGNGILLFYINLYFVTLWCQCCFSSIPPSIARFTFILIICFPFPQLLLFLMSKWV